MTLKFKKNHLVFALLATTLTSCAASQNPLVINVRDVPAAGGSPVIEAVFDLGTGAVPGRGAGVNLAGGQGRAVIGEFLLVRGSDFGKQPRVSIGGRGTEVLAHLEGGAVIVRVPWGIDVGQVELEVVHDRGRGARTLTVERLGLALGGGEVRPFKLGPQGIPEALPPLAVAGGRSLALSHDGSAAYVAVEDGGKAGLLVIDLTGAAPRVVERRALPGSRVIDLVVSEQTFMGAAITDTSVVIYNSENATNPSLYSPHAIPPELLQKKVIAGALGGQGRTLALLLADLNEVGLLNISEPRKMTGASVVDVLPGERLSLVSDLRLSGDGGTLWVASGDTPRSVEGGLQPARLTMLRVTPAQGEEAQVKGEVFQTWELGQSLTILEATVARGEPIPPGTAIRSEPSASAVYLSLAPSAVLGKGVEALASAGDKGRVVRSSLGKEPKDVLAGPWLMSSQDVTGKTQRMVALGCVLEQGKLRQLLVSGPVWEEGAAKVLPLGPAAQGEGALCPGMVRVQP